VTDCRMDNAELAAIYEADQLDRLDRLHGAFDRDLDALCLRDRMRHHRVRSMLAQGAVLTAADFFHAAVVFQHGSSLESYRQSHDLAMRARELGDCRATRLAAASLDRWFVAVGNRQLFGTQFHKVNGRWELILVDPSTTDEERAAWDVPSLAESLVIAEEMTANDRMPAFVSR
jgi:hypothetical protein